MQSEKLHPPPQEELKDVAGQIFHIQSTLQKLNDEFCEILLKMPSDNKLNDLSRNIGACSHKLNELRQRQRTLKRVIQQEEYQELQRGKAIKNDSSGRSRQFYEVLNSKNGGQAPFNQTGKTIHQAGSHATIVEGVFLGTTVCMKTISNYFKGSKSFQTSSKDTISYEEQRASYEEQRASLFSICRQIAVWNCDNVLKTYGLLVDPFKPQAGISVLSEYLERNLSDIFEDGSLAFNRKLIVTEQIIAGMAFIHDNNLYHGNLQPSNIFLTEQNDVKIGDFKILSSKRQTFNDYYSLSPEIRSAKMKEGTKETDVFAFGLLINQLFQDTRKLPVRNHQSLLELDTFVFNYDKQDKTKIPLTEAIIHCLQEEPVERCSFQNLYNRNLTKVVTENINNSYEGELREVLAVIPVDESAPWDVVFTKLSEVLGFHKKMAVEGRLKAVLGVDKTVSRKQLECLRTWFKKVTKDDIQLYLGIICSQEWFWGAKTKEDAFNTLHSHKYNFRDNVKGSFMVYWVINEGAFYDTFIDSNCDIIHYKLRAQSFEELITEIDRRHKKKDYPKKGLQRPTELLNLCIIEPLRNQSSYTALNQPNQGERNEEWLRAIAKNMKF